MLEYQRKIRKDFISKMKKACNRICYQCKISLVPHLIFMRNSHWEYPAESNILHHIIIKKEQKSLHNKNALYITITMSLTDITPFDIFVSLTHYSNN